ncbi:exported hypothetical protein [Candidatus Sulfopaludibacter sp. SbA3]|nr:exported hypothetical protein [Candidatus Sulfopaludibacter sp. SbA3]
MLRGKRARRPLAAFLAFCSVAAGTAAAQPIAKPQVANLIVKVENGVDE